MNGITFTQVTFGSRTHSRQTMSDTVCLQCQAVELIQGTE